MQLAIAVAVVMILITVSVILLFTSYGYDIRSRGADVGGPAAAVMFRMGMTLMDYRTKRKDHPVTDAALAKRSSGYRISAAAVLVITVVFIIIACLI